MSSAARFDLVHSPSPSRMLATLKGSPTCFTQKLSYLSSPTNDFRSHTPPSYLADRRASGWIRRHSSSQPSSWQSQAPIGRAQPSRSEGLGGLGARFVVSLGPSRAVKPGLSGMSRGWGGGGTCLMTPTLSWRDIIHIVSKALLAYMWGRGQADDRQLGRAGVRARACAGGRASSCACRRVECVALASVMVLFEVQAAASRAGAGPSRWVEARLGVAASPSRESQESLRAQVNDRHAGRVGGWASKRMVFEKTAREKNGLCGTFWGNENRKFPIDRPSSENGGAGLRGHRSSTRPKYSSQTTPECGRTMNDSVREHLGAGTGLDPAISIFSPDGLGGLVSRIGLGSWISAECGEGAQEILQLQFYHPQSRFPQREE
ncbi:hypothetical protein BD779DRAFT_1474496 [Infundibulicybe gibba]|nr:hypothetical protein BD779DRAFT_1474496 [Infundibulicybe gibba]